MSNADVAAGREASSGMDGESESYVGSDLADYSSSDRAPSAIAEEEVVEAGYGGLMTDASIPPPLDGEEEEEDVDIRVHCQATRTAGGGGPEGEAIDAGDGDGGGGGGGRGGGESSFSSSSAAAGGNTDTGMPLSPLTPRRPTSESTTTPTTTRFKFRYDPPDDERPYYDGLFRLACGMTMRSDIKGDDVENECNFDDHEGVILPPGDAAKFFLTSGVPPDRLRLVWNMAVAPATPYPPGVKPHPAMTYSQFRSAVRLIQLLQNGVTAMDEGLNATSAVGGEDVKGTQRAILSPPHFDGVSGMAVPLPASSRSMNRGAEVASTTRDRLSKSVTVGGDGGRGAPTRRPTHDSSSSGRGATKIHGLTGSYGVDHPIRRFTGNSVGSSGSNRIDQPTRKATADSRGSAGSNGVGQPTWMSTLNSKAREKGTKSSEDGVIVPGPEDHRYSMSRDDRHIYWETFARHCVSDGSGRRHVFVDAAVAFFERSGLTQEVIGGLWDVVARDPNGGKLDRREFAIMVHLLVCATRRGIALPDVLPTPLRIWRDGKRWDDDDDDDDEDDDDVLSVVDFMTGGGDIVEGSDSFNTQHSGNILDEDERMKRIEREIQSLKGLVASLRIEVRDLKDSLVHKGNAKSGRIANSVPAKMRFSNSSSEGDFLSASGRTQYENGIHRQSLTSDAPTVDVEMYWDERNVDSKESVRTTVIPTDASSTLSTIRIQPAEGPPSLLRNGGKMKSKTKRIVPGMSRNIPPIHPPSTGSRASSKSTKQFDHGAPQSRYGNAIPGASDNAMGARKSILYTPADSLTTQMQRVQQGAKFDNLIQTALEKITTGDSSSKNSGSRGRISPPQKVRRRRLTAESRHHSVRHIRRGLGGETEIYQELDVLTKSTRALDLQPL